MLAGAIVGIIIRFLPGTIFLSNILTLGGDVFIALMKVLVVPIVLVSIVCGVCSLQNVSAVGSMGFKSLKWFVLTTAVAVVLAIVVAQIFQIGMNLHLPEVPEFKAEPTLSFWQLISDIVPSNPVKAMADANMLQIIIFALLLGVAINIAGEAGRRIAAFFIDFNKVLMKFILMLIRLTPYGVFCLLAVLFANQGFVLILGILNYFLAVLFVLVIYAAVVYSVLLYMHQLSPKIFFQKIYTVVLFAFSVSSSNASIPLALNTVKNKLGVADAITSFVVPLGFNMNKNGTAIMQSIAAVFISHAYNIDLGLMGDFVLFVMVMLGSFGTAGVPGVGIVTLVMILEQLGLPTEGIALIIGIDRLLDMMRTAVNVIGNAVVTCLVGKEEEQLDYSIFQELGS